MANRNSQANTGPELCSIHASSWQPRVTILQTIGVLKGATSRQQNSKVSFLCGYVHMPALFRSAFVHKPEQTNLTKKKNSIRKTFDDEIMFEMFLTKKNFEFNSKFFLTTIFFEELRSRLCLMPAILVRQHCLPCGQNHVSLVTLTYAGAPGGL